jgi:hypothetical protein
VGQVKAKHVLGVSADGAGAVGPPATTLFNAAPFRFATVFLFKTSFWVNFLDFILTSFFQLFTASSINQNS